MSVYAKRLFPVVLLIFFHAAPLAARQPLTLNTFAGPPLSTPDQSGYYDRILREAFGRLQIPIVIGHLPAERSLLNASRGIDDGDFVRIAGMETRYPNLVMVPEKIDDFAFVVFTRRAKPAAVDWRALTPYHVGIVRGWKILEENLSGVKELTAVKNQELLFTLLKNDRVDAVVYARNEGNGLLGRLGIADARVLEPPLAVRPMFMYLNRKHVALISPLAATLAEMKGDGTIAAFARQTLPPPNTEEGRSAHP
ncbi:MAG: transporter substrate-binding domain-containing protein [Thermodesulfobacteriota bacterium]